MKYYIYKTTNIVNNKIYIGVHKSDDFWKDPYLGSGKHFNNAIIKYGRDKFKKQILYQFNTKEQAYQMQSYIVDKQFVKQKDTYNLKIGGEGGFDHLRGTVTAQDKDGNYIRVHVDDQRYVSGQLVFMCKDKVIVKDQNNIKFSVSITDPRYLSGQLAGVNKGSIIVKDIEGNTFQVDKNDPRYLSGELKFVLSDYHPMAGRVVVKDDLGNVFSVLKNDIRWLSGDLVGINKNRKLVNGHAMGEKNSQYGTRWITNGFENKKIKKTQAIPEQWKPGRIIKK